MHTVCSISTQRTQIFPFPIDSCSRYAMLIVLRSYYSEVSPARLRICQKREIKRLDIYCCQWFLSSIFISRGGKIRDVIYVYNFFSGKYYTTHNSMSISYFDSSNILHIAYINIIRAYFHE